MSAAAAPPPVRAAGSAAAEAPATVGSGVGAALQRTHTQRPAWEYLLYELRLPAGELGVPFDDAFVHNHVAAALQSMHGVVGGAVPLDVLVAREGRAVVRVPRDCEERVLGAVAAHAAPSGAWLELARTSGFLAPLAARLL